MTVRRMGHRARVAALVGAVVATGAVALMAVVSGTAAAAPAAGQSGRCVDNVNVRAEPDPTADIVAVCERGQAVQVGETRDGFVHLLDLDGWSAQQYIAVGGRMPVRPSTAHGADPTGHGHAATGTDSTPRTTGTDGAGSSYGTRGTGTQDGTAGPEGTATTDTPTGTDGADSTAAPTPGDGPGTGDRDGTGTDGPGAGGGAPQHRGLAGLLGG
jgi:hypothetical protein